MNTSTEEVGRDDLRLDADTASTEIPTSPLELAVANARANASKWIDNAVSMLISVRRGLLSKSSVDIRTQIGLPIVRRHFHTDRAALPEAEAIMKVEKNFDLMRRLLGVGESFFEYPEEDTAAESTRGFFGSDFVVPAYTYTRCVVAITPQFLAIGPMCRAAVIVHQMAHFIDPGVRDQTGVFGPRYDSLNFEQAVFNVHSYANFAVNSLPPYLDERFGVARLDV